MLIFVQGKRIMANEKNTPVNNKTGEVTHKLVITTTEGNFTVSLFSNNEVHQDFAKAFCGDADISGLFSALTTNVVIVKNEQAPKDESRLARLAALKAAPSAP